MRSNFKKRAGIIAVMLFTALGLRGQDITLMTYNIKYDNTRDTVNNWNDRKAPMVKLIRQYRPHIFGTQEALHHQVAYLDSSLTHYSYIGVGRDDGKQKGEYSSIHYDHTRYKAMESGTFWLSKTPSVVSVGWDAALERICTYGLFEDLKSGQKLWVFNTHFDHIGVKARKKSAKLILKKIKQINSEKFPVVLMGDLNLTPEKKPIQSIRKSMDDGLSVSKTPLQGPRGTFNGFDTTDPMERRIDYIFVQGLSVGSYVHIDERLDNGKHVSDHLPVFLSTD